MSEHDGTDSLVRSDVLLDTSVLVQDGKQLHWTVREMLEYWQDDTYIGDSIDIAQAVFDIRQLAKMLLPNGGGADVH